MNIAQPFKRSGMMLTCRKDSGVATPADFKGKKVGVLTGTSTEYVYRMLLSKLGIPKSSFTEIEAPFDLATFLAGEYDVRPAFIYDEPVSLDLKQVQYSIIQPEKFGVVFLGTVYFTTKKFAVGVSRGSSISSQTTTLT